MLTKQLAEPRFRDKTTKAQPVSYGIDDALSASGESSSAVLSFVPLDSLGSPFKSTVSLYIGVGGM